MFTTGSFFSPVKSNFAYIRGYKPYPEKIAFLGSFSDYLDIIKLILKLETKYVISSLNECRLNKYKYPKIELIAPELKACPLKNIHFRLIEP